LTGVTEHLPAAVLWDMDGTLVDTEPAWLAAEAALVEQFGGVWHHEDSVQLIGQGLGVTARFMQTRGVDLPEREIIERLTAIVLQQIEREIPWRPGARELLSALRDAGVPTALVTMSIRPLAERMVNGMGFSAFDHIVSGDDVDQPKPHPQPYLRAAELLGVDIAECVAIEDSIPGVQSALDSGAHVIGVPNIIKLPEQRGVTLWPSLAGRTVADLVAEYAERTSR
jgi:HAD superfamily hydrolase (TIGR01509 family)